MLAVSVLLAVGVRKLERVTRRPGLSYLVLGIALLGVAVAGLAGGRRLMPALFAVFAIRYVILSRRLRAVARESDAARDQFSEG